MKRKPAPFVKPTCCSEYNPTRRPECFSLLTCYYNLLFWMLFVPFRVKRDMDNECFILKTNVIQSVSIIYTKANIINP